jgi:hypothetical protein
MSALIRSALLFHSIFEVDFGHDMDVIIWTLNHCRCRNVFCTDLNEAPMFSRQSKLFGS